MLFFCMCDGPLRVEQFFSGAKFWARGTVNCYPINRQSCQTCVSGARKQNGRDLLSQKSISSSDYILLTTFFRRIFKNPQTRPEAS